MSEVRKWWVWWTDEDRPADGVVEVMAESAEDAIVKADEVLHCMWLDGEGPEHWRWEYEPSDECPSWVE